MKRIKVLSSIVLATMFLAMQVLAVGAAPAIQDTTPITGTVVEITLETNTETGITTVLVTLDDGTGTLQTFRLSLEDAATLGLVVDDQPVDPASLVDPIEIDPALVIPDETQEEAAQHPVGSALSNFFSELLGVDYDTIMGYHDDGVGFGVIAQALWMTNALEGDSETFAAIMEAKQNNDYSAITLPDGSIPKNWGQFRKAVMHDREKAKENLGAVMSGRADQGQGEEIQTQTETQAETQVQSQNNGAGNNPGQNNGNGSDKNKDKGNNGKNNDNWNNKNKDKGKGNPH